MSWGGSAPNQVFTRTDGTRTGTQVWTTAAAASVKIVAPDHDIHDQDVADGVSACIKKDGGNTATASLPMGGFRHTNVGVAQARTEYARFSDHQDEKGIYCPTVGGTADAITLTTGYTVTAYAAGQRYTFIAASTNSSTATVNVDGLGVKNITGPAAATLAAGQIVAAALVTIIYDGTQFQLQADAAVGIPVGTVMAWPMTTVPSGFLEADGSAVSRTTYSALFAVYGTAYGVGNGSTTFNLPNYKDYFLRGFDASGTNASSRTDRGDGTTGAAVGTKQAGDYLSHTHTGTTGAGGAHSHTSNGGGSFYDNSGGATVLGSGGTSIGLTGTTSTSATHTHAFTSAASPTSGGDETRPKNITVKWIILALPGGALPVGSGATVSPRTMHTGSAPAQVSTDGTDTTPAVDKTYICEIYVPAPTTVTGIAVMNGSAVAGNIALALANSLGAVVASTASTAASGTDAYQRVAFTSSYQAIGPGTFYVLLQCNNTSQRFNSHAFGNFGAAEQTGQTYGTFTTITPPTTFTPAKGPIASLY